MPGVLSTAIALTVLLLQPVSTTGSNPIVGGSLTSPAPAQLTVACDDFTTSTGRGAAGSASLTRDLAVAPGGTFSVTLCSNGSTGFSWETPVFDSTAIAAVDHTAAGPSDVQLVGAAGTETWTFRLLGKGGGIDFAYSQPWAGGTKGAWTLRVNVIAGDAVAIERSVACQTSGAVTGLVRPDPLAVRVGQTFDVTLCANPSTGFAWKRVDLSDNPLALVAHDTIAASSGLMGAAGVEKWTFKAVGPGDHALVFWYLRAWEGVPQLGVVWLMVNVTA